MQLVTPLTVTKLESPHISPSRSTLPRLASTFLHPRTFGPDKSLISREGLKMLNSVDAK